MKPTNRTLLGIALCGALAAPIASAQLVDRNLTRGQVELLQDKVELRGEARAAAHSEVAVRDAWARLDVDADGRVSLEEADADDMFLDAFTRIDADGDGFVSDAEYRAHAHLQHVAEASATGAGHAAGHAAVVARATWADLDADGDGRISLAEATIDAGFEAGFADMDADGDGFVTQAEFRAEARADSIPPR